jgi:hypothetical protein
MQKLKPINKKQKVPLRRLRMPVMYPVWMDVYADGMRSVLGQLSMSPMKELRIELGAFTDSTTTLKDKPLPIRATYLAVGMIVVSEERYLGGPSNFPINFDGIRKIDMTEAIQKWLPSILYDEQNTFLAVEVPRIIYKSQIVSPILEPDTTFTVDNRTVLIHTHGISEDIGIQDTTRMMDTIFLPIIHHATVVIVCIEEIERDMTFEQQNVNRLEKSMNMIKYLSGPITMKNQWAQFRCLWTPQYLDKLIPQMGTAIGSFAKNIMDIKPKNQPFKMKIMIDLTDAIARWRRKQPSANRSVSDDEIVGDIRKQAIQQVTLLDPSLYAGTWFQTCIHLVSKIQLPVEPVTDTNIPGYDEQRTFFLFGTEHYHLGPYWPYHDYNEFRNHS